MQQLVRFFKSPKVALSLLVAFATAMAVATFVENDFGTPTAWQWVYDAWWFELVMLGLALCFVANIAKYKLWSRRKWSVLLFHLAFIMILVGAAITRYHSYGGVLRIREGTSSNLLLSSEQELILQVSNGAQARTLQKKLAFNTLGGNDFTINSDLDGVPIKVQFQEFLVDAAPEVLVDDPDGRPMLELVYSAGEQRETLFIEWETQYSLGPGLPFISYGLDDPTHLRIFPQGDSLVFTAPVTVQTFQMATQAAGMVPAYEDRRFNLRTLYRLGDASIVPIGFHDKAAVRWVSEAVDASENSPTKEDRLLLDLQVGEKSTQLAIPYKEGFLPQSTQKLVDGYMIEASYGAKPLVLPFSVYLNDFQLERYPGSSSPSSYASEVTVLDGDLEFPFRIYMNHVLDHKGFRFYQASYDTDEQGTVLAVNHDWWGTYVTYLGYLLMTLGMAFTLFGKHSRFRQLNKKLSRIKKFGLLILLFFNLHLVQAQDSAEASSQFVPTEQAAAFGVLLVQDLDGRIKPLNTLASEFLRKLSRRPYYRSYMGNVRTDVSADQVFLAIQMDPNSWQDIPLIKIDPKKGGVLFNGLERNPDDLVSFASFVTSDGGYILEQAVEEANRKKPANQSELDKEILKVDERFNILYNLLAGNYLKVFPNKLDANRTWFGPNHHFEDFTEEDARFCKEILELYFTDLLNADYQKASEHLSYLSTYQQVLAADYIPEESRVKAELLYNQINFNFWMFQFAFMLGSLLLVLALARIFTQKPWLDRLWIFLVFLGLLGLLAFTANIILRWYVAGHAPWSNGYEMIVFVAWVLLLCGFLTYKKSDFALPLATLFSGALLFVSYLDWLSPEITNLMPVLKSYWLKVHVATIVSSYAPLALSAILGLMALLLGLLKTKTNADKIEIKITELTYINEISMTIGLFVLAVGTFLGGIWANESWGRYWAWDPKETWALISVIVYAIVLHLRFVPSLNNKLVLNIASVWAFGSIIMTSFGVNYYLSGLHSYAAGDPLPVPKFIYVLVLVLLVVSISAVWKQRSIRSQ